MVIEMNDEIASGKSAIAAPHDDDDDIYIYIVLFTNFLAQSTILSAFLKPIL